MRELFNRHVPLWSFPLFLQNVLMTLRHDYGSAWTGATWSLAVEEQFYLLLPFAIRRLSSRGTLALTLGMIVAAPLLRAVLTQHGAYGLATYTLLPCRADALGGGVLVAIACRNQAVWEWLVSHRRYLIAAFVLLGIGVAFWILLDLQLGGTWMAAFYTSLLALVVVTPGRAARLAFTSLPLVRLGTVAYAVYLFHSGILRLFHYWFFGKVPALRDMPTLYVSVLALATVFLLTGISWRLLEKPLIQRARRKYRYLSGASL
jgi:peptidoglycan/LPS O-acetylase OafA/YrhL